MIQHYELNFTYFKIYVKILFEFQKQYNVSKQNLVNDCLENENIFTNRRENY